MCNRSSNLDKKIYTVKCRIQEVHVLEPWTEEIIYANKIIAVEGKTYTVAKIKPEKEVKVRVPSSRIFFPFSFRNCISCVRL